MRNSTTYYHDTGNKSFYNCTKKNYLTLLNTEIYLAIKYADDGYKKESRISQSTQLQYFEDKHDNTLLNDCWQDAGYIYIYIYINTLMVTRIESHSQ